MKKFICQKNTAKVAAEESTPGYEMEFMMFNDVRAVWVQGEIVILRARVCMHVRIRILLSTRAHECLDV